MILEKPEDAWGLEPGILGLNSENITVKKVKDGFQNLPLIPFADRQCVCDAADYLLAHWKENRTPPIDLKTRAEVIVTAVDAGFYVPYRGSARRVRPGELNHNRPVI